MIFKVNLNFYHIRKVVLLLFLTNITNLYAHNIFNGGCREHCGEKFQIISNDSKFENVNDQIDNEAKNSCLNKSLCRG